jgi:hypothetical protein
VVPLLTKSPAVSIADNDLYGFPTGKKSFLSLAYTSATQKLFFQNTERWTSDCPPKTFQYDSNPLSQAATFWLLTAPTKYFAFLCASNYNA